MRKIGLDSLMELGISWNYGWMIFQQVMFEYHMVYRDNLLST
jgi:hypothetical protein